VTSTSTATSTWASTGNSTWTANATSTSTSTWASNSTSTLRASPLVRSPVFPRSEEGQQDELPARPKMATAGRR